MSALAISELDERQRKALAIHEARMNGIDQTLAAAKKRSQERFSKAYKAMADESAGHVDYTPWTEIDNASDVDQFIEGPQS